MNEKTKDLIFTSVMITLFAVVSFVLFSLEKSGGLVEFAIEQGIEPPHIDAWFSVCFLMTLVIGVFVIIFLRGGSKQMEGTI